MESVRLWTKYLMLHDYESYGMQLNIYWFVWLRSMQTKTHLEVNVAIRYGMLQGLQQVEDSRYWCL